MLRKSTRRYRVYLFKCLHNFQKNDFECKRKRCTIYVSLSPQASNDEGVTSVFTIVQYFKRSLKTNDYISFADTVMNNFVTQAN